MNVSLKRVVDLTDEELVRCRQLSFGDEGYMCEDLDAILLGEKGKRRYRYSEAIFIHDHRMIYGWALMQPVPRSPRYTFQLFVDPEHRGKGYGHRLLTMGNGLQGWKHKPICYPDDENEWFFNKYPSLYTEV